MALRALLLIELDINQNASLCVLWYKFFFSYYLYYVMCRGRDEPEAAHELQRGQGYDVIPYRQRRRYDVIRDDDPCSICS